MDTPTGITAAGVLFSIALTPGGFYIAFVLTQGHDSVYAKNSLGITKVLVGLAVVAKFVFG